MIKVRNLIGTSKLNPPADCNSWLEYFNLKKGFNKYARVRCAVHKNHYADVGAHVVKVNSVDKSHYIVPVCYAVNNSDDEFYVDETMMVKIEHQ